MTPGRIVRFRLKNPGFLSIKYLQQPQVVADSLQIPIRFKMIIRFRKRLYARSIVRYQETLF